MTKAKPPLILLHGAWHGAWCWEGNFKEFFEGEGFEVICPDLPSHGTRHGEGPMWRNRISTYVGDMERLIDSFDTPPILIGHSMGGFVAQHLLTRGANLAGVGLMSTVPAHGAFWSTLRTALTSPAKFIQANLAWSLRNNSKIAKAWFLDDDADPKFQLTFAQRLQDESILAFLDMMALNLPPKSHTKTPVLVIGGGGDKLFSPASQRATARRYAAPCLIVEDAPHNPMSSKIWPVAGQHFLNWINSL